MPQAVLSSAPTRLNLGCGRGTLEGWTNCDLYPGPKVDQVFDLCAPWPIPDDSVSEIYASHVLEHLTDFRTFFREAHRVLRPNGSMFLRLPYGGHKAAWWDVEHVRPWYAETFAFLQPGYSTAIGNPQHDSWTAFFGIHIVDIRVSLRMARLLKRRLLRWLLISKMDWIDNACEELWVHLYALKTPDAIGEYLAVRLPYTVPCRYVAYRHHLRGKDLPQGQPTELVGLLEGEVVNGFY